ncbi:hypothetical protein D3C86_1895300 [compost metagenome]
MAALQASIEAVQHIPTDPGPAAASGKTKPQTGAASRKKTAAAKSAKAADGAPVVNEATGPIPVIAPKPKRRTAKSKEPGA